MPRPVVPILRLPRKRSETLSITRWYGAMIWADSLTSRREQSRPRDSRPSISSKSTSGSTTTPLPITGVTFGLMMPLGSRCSAYDSSPTTTVWPALLPPLKRAT